MKNDLVKNYIKEISNKILKNSTYGFLDKSLPKGFNPNETINPEESKNPKGVYSSILDKYIDPKTGEILEDET